MSARILPNNSRGNRHLGHMEDGVTGMRDDLGADLHQLIPHGAE